LTAAALWLFEEYILFFSSFLFSFSFLGVKIICRGSPSFIHPLIVILMCTFILKSYNQKVEIRKPHFFILNKGNNSGKPLLTPCPNCFTIQFDNTEDKEQVYWLMHSLWQSKAFYTYLRGSVIPFVVLRDVKSCIVDGLKKSDANPAQFEKAVAALHSLEDMEKKFKQNLKLIQDAKQMLFYKYL
jgi:hypothetical protein